jgi:hypothetical protein
MHRPTHSPRDAPSSPPQATTATSDQQPTCDDEHDTPLTASVAVEQCDELSLGHAVLLQLLLRGLLPFRVLLGASRSVYLSRTLVTTLVPGWPHTWPASRLKDA